MKLLFQMKSLSIFMLIASISISSSVYANTQEQQQTVREDYGRTVTLVTSGTGSTENEAIKNALRNAIEQTYGTFVSANTTVLNDELVSDAISTVSSGSVLSYKKISSISMSDGEYQVTLQTILSIGNLVTFAKSHGMTAELAGNSFLINRNLARLNKQNEMNALKNLISQLTIIVEKGMYDYSVKVGQPTGNGIITVGVRVEATPNSNYNLFWDTIDKTLSSLSISSTESANYKTLGMSTYEYAYGPSWERFKIGTSHTMAGTKSKYILRNNVGRVAYGRVLNKEDTEYYFLNLIEALEKIGKYGYEIYDNLGTIISTDVESGSNKVGRAVDGYRIGYGTGDNVRYYSIVLKAKSDTSNPVYEIPQSTAEYDFLMLYSEDRLSKLQKISVRPNPIKLH